MDSTVDIIQQRTELERRGVWKTINQMAEDDLEQQLEAIAVQRKKTEMNLDKIVEMFEADTQAIKAKRTAGFRESKEAILMRRQQKAD